MEKAFLIQSRKTQDNKHFPFLNTYIKILKVTTLNNRVPSFLSFSDIFSIKNHKYLSYQEVAGIIFFTF